MTEYITNNMLKELQEELDILVKKNRPEILARLKHARAFGDLSENAEYTEARKEQGKNESKISEIEIRLKNIEIVDESNLDGSVQIGSVVILIDDNANAEIRYEIVSENSADIEKNRISDSSPIGNGLIGKKVGESFVFESPSGSLKYTVKSIE